MTVETVNPTDVLELFQTTDVAEANEKIGRESFVRDRWGRAHDHYDRWVLIGYGGDEMAFTLARVRR